MVDLGWPLSKAIHRCIGKPEQPDGRRNEVHFRETNPSASRASVPCPNRRHPEALARSLQIGSGKQSQRGLKPPSEARRSGKWQNGKTTPPFLIAKSISWMHHRVPEVSS